MDNVTHTLTGLILARAGLDRFTPRAAWILVLAANAPDIDVVTAFGGSLNYLHWHRHITQSLAALPLVALAPLLVIRLFGRIPWTRAWCVSLIGVGSHLLMDWTNMYGIRLLLPFSSRWLRLDILNVVDLCILAVLLLAVVSPFLSRLVSSEIGARAGSGAGLARVALAFILLYGAAA